MINRRIRKLGLDKYCRYAIAFLGSIGFVITAYLTITKLSQSSTICPTEGYEIVLSSPYAEKINGIPLSLFGFT